MRFTTNHDKTAWDDPPVAIFGRGAGARAAFVVAALLPGRPLLYNGQEVESPQKLGLFEREPVAWSQAGAARTRSFYAAVMRLARTEPGLIGRDLDVVETSAPDDVIAYRRRDVLVVVNARTKGVRAAVNAVDLTGARDLLSGARQKGDTIALPPYGATVLKVRPQQWSSNTGEVFYQIFVRSFRDSNGDGIGDLRGIQEKLAYLQNLGVTSVLLTPINPSPFYHNYFASSFEGVDSSFGGAGAYRELVKAIHGRGMKLYLDQEIQYVAGDHPWWRESRRQPGSQYGSYVLYNDPGNTQPIWGASVPTYAGERVELAFVNLLDPKVKDYFQRLFVSLIDPNRDGRLDDGVDGFRIDHMMDDLDMKGRLTNLFADFWGPIFARARAANPRVKIIAEQFDWGYGEDFLTRGGADMVFAFPLRNAIKSFNPRAIADTAAEMWRRTPPGKGQLIFIENHDMNRFASEMDGDVRKEKIGAALNILLRGTPLIYYGQEIGMKGRQNKSWGTDANDIPVREAFEWTRKGESTGLATWYRGRGTDEWWTNRYAKDSDGISVEEEDPDSTSLLSFYRRLLKLRRERPELVSGEQRFLETDRANVLAVLRGSPEQASLVLVNLADSATTVSCCRPERASASEGAEAESWPLRGVHPERSEQAQGDSLRDLLSGSPAARADSTLRVQLPPFGIKLLAIP
jgi:glycosidase